MDSWVVLPESTAAPHRGKGGKGGGKKGGFEQPSKKAKVEKNSSSAVVNALLAVGDLGQQNARDIRQLFGMAVVTVLCPRNPAAEAASAVEVIPTEPLKADLQRWSIFIKALGTCNKVSPEVRKVLTDYGATVPNIEALQGLILKCDSMPTYNDSEQFKIQISVAASLQMACAAVVNALIQLGGTAKFGGPPRSAAERTAAAALRLLR
jgi:hypothetical protein